MKIVADLHLHSKYSRAVSSKMELPTMAQWASKKGLDLLAIPDWTQPVWLKEVELLLTEAAEGIYRLKNDRSGVRFVFSTEISAIYSQGGKGRRIHNLIMAPSITTVYKINNELKKRGFNLISDGRPIINLSSVQLAELVFGIDERCLIVPAHIWTPWFSMFGSRSGFDSIKECWGGFADKIYGVETGLSSDPAMNWQIGQLDKKSILSFSDAHSPAKMGREATVLQTKSKNPSVNSSENGLDSFTFSDLAGVIKQTKNCPWKIAYTIEFYPEEGKYHWTGHRNCGISLSPAETKNKGIMCPVCGRPLTVGVEHRVQDLATAKVSKQPRVNKVGLVGYYHEFDVSRPPYIMSVPLQEIIAESLGITSVYSSKVQNQYEQMIVLAPEVDLLTKTKLSEIEAVAGSKIAEGINKVRQGNIVVKPGYDGEFGIVKIWNDKSPVKRKQSVIAEKNDKNSKTQMSLF